MTETSRRRAGVAFLLVFVIVVLGTGAPMWARTASQDPPAQPPQQRDPGRGMLPEWARNAWMFRRVIDTPIAITNANVIDVARGATLVIVGDEIRSVSNDPPPTGAQIIDANGGYIVPGLFDLHAHVIPQHLAFPTALPPEETLARLLAHGVTMIRCLPLASESGHQWAGAVTAGTMTGPMIVPASSIFEMEPQRTSFGFGDPETAKRWVLREAAMGTK